MSRKLKCVLLIDDDEDDNFFHQIVIDKMDIAEQVQVAESGEEALELLKTKHLFPDLIFLDINMPRMTGWEFMDEYNRMFKDPPASVIIIILTTSVNPAEKELSKTIRGISGFISKPVTEKMLSDILNTYFPVENGRN